MNVWDHLGELRKRLLVCLYVLLAALPVGFYFVNAVISWIAKPAGELVFVQPMEAFSAQLHIALGLAFLIALPVILYQAWSFVSLGLMPKERTYVKWIMPISYLGFMLGAAFSALWLFPRAVTFLLSLKTEALVPMLSISGYLDLFILLCVSMGILFELPLALHFLTKLGILQPGILIRNRRMSYFIIFLLASVFNPGPDVLTQVVMAGAAIALFEISILLVRWETKRKHH